MLVLKCRNVSVCFTMESTVDVLPIQELPDEILELVLSFLSLKDQKSASLVCQRWSRLAVRPADVVLVLDSNRDMVENYLHFSMTSDRCYKHLRIAAFPNPYAEVAAEVVINRFRHSLLSLELDKLGNFQHIWELCSNIRCLNIVQCFAGDAAIDEELVLRPLPRLRHLRTSTTFFHLRGIDVGQVAPNLTALSVDSESYDLPTNVLDYFAPRLTQLQLEQYWSKDHPIWRYRFPQLLRFRCQVGEDLEKDLANFLARCGNLQVISLGKHSVLSSRFFQNLTHSCRHLRELSLDKVQLGQTSFQLLCSLRQLKRLHICRAIVKVLNPDFPPSDLRELVLESADVQDMASFNASVEAAFPKLVGLHIKYTSEEPLRLSNFKHLESVHLENTNFGLNSDLLAELTSLHRLHSISVRSLEFNIANLKIKPDLSRIRRLSVWTQLDDNRLKLLTGLFPALTLLKLCGRLKCSAKGLRESKQLLPLSCEVQLFADGELLPRRDLKVQKDWCCEWRN